MICAPCKASDVAGYTQHTWGRGIGCVGRSRTYRRLDESLLQYSSKSGSWRLRLGRGRVTLSLCAGTHTCAHTWRSGSVVLLPSAPAVTPCLAAGAVGRTVCVSQRCVGSLGVLCVSDHSLIKLFGVRRLSSAAGLASRCRNFALLAPCSTATPAARIRRTESATRGCATTAATRAPAVPTATSKPMAACPRAQSHPEESKWSRRWLQSLRRRS